MSIKSFVTGVVLFCLSLSQVPVWASDGRGHPQIETMIRLAYQGYVESHNQSVNFHRSVLALLSQPNPATLEYARQSYCLARLCYAHIATIQYFPYLQDAGIYGRIVPHSFDVKVVEAMLFEDTPLDEELHNQSGLLGFSVLEYLLWGPNQQREGREFQDQPGHSSRLRRYLFVASLQLTQDLKSLAWAWNLKNESGVAWQIRNLSGVQLVQYSLQAIRDHARILQRGLSGQMGAALQHQELLSIESLYWGRYGTYQGMGLDPFFAKYDAPWNDAVKGQIQHLLEQPEQGLRDQGTWQSLLELLDIYVKN